MFRSQKVLFALTTILLFMMVLAGCGAQKAEETAAGPKTTTAANQTNEAIKAPSEEVRTIQHVMGSTQIKGTPKRIVTLFQGGTDAVVAFGLTPVGVVQANGDQPVYDYLKNKLAGVQMLGLETQPNLEEISKLKPDVIITSKFRHEKIYDQLSQIAPTVMVEELYEWKKTVELVGQALNKQDDAAKLLTAWDKRVADFKAKMGSKLPIEVAIVNFRADHARVYYMGYAGQILKELGFTRPKGHDQDIWGVKLSSKESIPDLDADMLFVFNSGTDATAIQKTYDEWTSHPLWKTLKAYKNNQIVKVDEVNWNLAGGYLTANLMLDDLYQIFKLQK